MHLEHAAHVLVEAVLAVDQVRKPPLDASRLQGFAVVL
jgi:hypothetical protein